MNTEKDIVAKYGGSSLANAEGFIAVGNIIKEDRRRRIIIPSAPGKEKGIENSEKITDLLIICGELSFRNISYELVFSKITKRFQKIGSDLKICVDEYLEEIEQGLLARRESEIYSVSWAASRGEWFSGRVLAKYLEAEFVDAAEIMRFQDNGEFDQEKSYDLISQKLQGLERFVVPGYYGQDNKGNIRVFPRGGSDITGAYIAAGLNANIYENWTDVDGVMTADPRIVPQARSIPFLTYEEMAELGYGGAKVLHPSSVGPCEEIGIPINIRNTFNPRHPGTIIGRINFLLEKSYLPE